MASTWPAHEPELQLATHSPSFQLLAWTLGRKWACVSGDAAFVGALRPRTPVGIP